MDATEQPGDDTATGSRRRTADPVLPRARTLGKGLAVLRIVMGVVLFACGVAKPFEFRRIEVIPYVRISSTRARRGRYCRTA